MARVYNFSAGPSMLPESVLRKAADEMLDYQGSGQSVMEMSHRSKIYDGIIKGAEALFRELPDTGDVPLIADISSCFLSEPIDVTKFGMLYGGAQKNVAPAGLTICIIREDLLGNARDYTPSMLDYKLMADNDSLYNTPPCYTIYICKLVLEWLKENGGLEAMRDRNVKKAELLYNFLDNSKMFNGTVVKKDRSLMNVPFVTESEELNAKFVKEATDAGLVNLKGHRSVGGMRASIYNAMPYEGVEKLVKFMADFEKANS